MLKMNVRWALESLNFASAGLPERPEDPVYDSWRQQSKLTDDSKHTHGSLQANGQ